MDGFTVYCSQEQTERAYKLGAPIEMDSHTHGIPYIQIGTDFMLCPTAEQMRGWLRDEKGIAYIESGEKDFVLPALVIKEIGTICHIEGHFKTHGQAILAAIDVALDYLEENNRSDRL